MRFHGLMLTRDDQDIIAQCLAHALTWADAIYVYDTGSSDDTWDIVNDFAARDPRVIPWKHEVPAVMLKSGLRGYLFHHFRERAEPGDWFAQVDTDEFFHIAPPTFVREHLRPGDTGAYNFTIEFRITQSELATWEAGDSRPFDRTKPIVELRRHYNTLVHGEPRLFRYRRSMQWSPDQPYPWNMGYISRWRIPVRHYPHRDPIQLQKRHRLRLRLAPLADPNWAHWRHADWREMIAADDSADLHHWKPGSELPTADPLVVNSSLKRFMQWSAHRFLLPVLDRRRAPFPADFKPILIPKEMNDAAIADMRALDLQMHR